MIYYAIKKLFADLKRISRVKRTLSAIAIVFVVTAMLCGPFFALAQPFRPEFNPNQIIPDEVFSDTQTLGGATGVQIFLESKGSPLANTSQEFLVRLNEPTDPALKTKLDDPQANLGRLRTAAELIWDVSIAAGINPQVILVTLNKEQSLITGNPRDLQKALNRAMGFDCPDSSGCGNLFPGFYYQLFGNVDTAGNRYLGAAKSLSKSFNTPTGRGPQHNGRPAQVGETIVLANTMGGYDGILPLQLVTIANRATAALYRYTPHVFNGNYNFWRFFTSWFQYPNGTLVTLLDRGTTYVLQNGNRKPVPEFVAALRSLDLSKAVVLSPAEMDGYPLLAPYGPPDGSIVVFGDTTYVFTDSIKRPVSQFVLVQRKIGSAKVSMTEAEASIFPLGSQLPPLDGTVVKGVGEPHVYRVDKGVLKRFSPYTFRQYKAAKSMQTLPDTEVAAYSNDGFVPPLPGTVVTSKSSQNPFVMRAGFKEPLTAELFRNLGYVKKDIVMLATDEEIASFPLGAPPPPKDGTIFSIGKSNELYLYSGGAKHRISPFVAGQKKIKPAYAFEASIATNWPSGIVVPPLDGTLVKAAHSPSVFVVRQGQLRALTGELFKNLGYSFKNVISLSDEEVRELPAQGFAEPRERTFFAVKKSGELYLFSKGELHSISPFVAKQRSITPDYAFDADTLAGWKRGKPIPPRDGSIVKGDASATIYLVRSQKLSAFSEYALKRRGYKKSAIRTLPQEEVDGYEKGAVISR